MLNLILNFHFGIDKIKVLLNFIQLRFDMFPIEDVFVLFETK